MLLCDKWRIFKKRSQSEPLCTCVNGQKDAETRRCGFSLADGTNGDNALSYHGGSDQFVDVAEHLCVG